MVMGMAKAKRMSVNTANVRLLVNIIIGGDIHQKILVKARPTGTG